MESLLVGKMHAALITVGKCALAATACQYLRLDNIALSVYANVSVHLSITSALTKRLDSVLDLVDSTPHNVLRRAHTILIE